MQCASCPANLGVFARGQPSIISRSIWSTNLPWQPRPSDCTDSSPVIPTSGQKAEPVSRKSPRASSLPTCNHLKTFVHLWTIECGRYCQGGESENNHVLRLKALGSQDATQPGAHLPLSPHCSPAPASVAFLLPLHAGSFPQQGLGLCCYLCPERPSLDLPRAVPSSSVTSEMLLSLPSAPAATRAHLDAPASPEC